MQQPLIDITVAVRREHILIIVTDHRLFEFIFNYAYSHINVSRLIMRSQAALVFYFNLQGTMPL